MIPEALAFHFDMAAHTLARGWAASAVIQIGHTEGWWRPTGLGADCTVAELYHRLPECAEAVDWELAMTWTTQSVVDLVEAVAARTLEDGCSQLDHTLVVWASDDGSAGSHSLEDIPVVVIGGAALGNTGRRTIDADGYDQADLAVTIADRAGVELEAFGDASHQAQIIEGVFE